MNDVEKALKGVKSINIDYGGLLTAINILEKLLPGNEKFDSIESLEQDQLKAKLNAADQRIAILEKALKLMTNGMAKIFKDLSEDEHYIVCEDQRVSYFNRGILKR